MAKFWLAVNHLPVVRDDSDAYWRRQRLIPFRRKFSDADREDDLEAKLLAELPGILTWAVQGAVEWYQHRLQAPDVVMIATAAYRHESDPLADFLAERCVLSDGRRVQAGTLYTPDDHCLSCDADIVVYDEGGHGYCQTHGREAGIPGAADA